MFKLFPIFLSFAILAPHAEAGDYTRLCMNGEVAGEGICPLKPLPGEAANAWACTRDDRRQRVWSLEIRSGHWDFATRGYPASVNATGRCGFSSGWRTPTRSELLSIRVKNSVVRQAIDPDYFPDTASGGYWSADTFAPDPGYAWFVYFATGYNNAGNAYSGFKTYTQYVRLLRSLP